VACTLARAGLARAPDFGERAQRVPLAPRLAVGVRAVEGAVPGMTVRSLEVFAWVRWPLGGQRVRGLGDLGPLSARRQSLAEAAAARARALATVEARAPSDDLRERIDDQLDREQATAELDALTGEGCR
jgi:hypothetical protein